METNPPRNSQSETHPDDERGRRPCGWRLHRMDRFPDASENSSRKLPRSGILVVLRGEVGFELRRQHVAERRVQALLVVDLLQEVMDRGARLGQVPVFVAMDLFLLQGFHERLAGRVVIRVAFTAHADLGAILLQ